MEIKFDIDASQMDETLVEIFKNISQEQKEEIARDVLRGWLSENAPMSVEERQKIILKQMQDEDIHDGTKHTNAQIVESYEFNRRMREVSSLKDIILKEVHKDVYEYYKKVIQYEIENDPAMQEMKDEAYKAILSNMPAIMVNAMSDIIAKSMGSMQSMVQESLRMSTNSQVFIDGLQNRSRL